MLPGADSFSDQVRQSCSACTALSAIAVRQFLPSPLFPSRLERRRADLRTWKTQLNGDRIDSFIDSVQPRPQDGLRLPLQFDSVDDELNLFA